MGRFEELLLIAVVALLLFGPNKVTELAKGLGGFVREFKKASNPEDEAKPQSSETKNPTA